jgi:hypothetical protein
LRKTGAVARRARQPSKGGFGAVSGLGSIRVPFLPGVEPALQIATFRCSSTHRGTHGSCSPCPCYARAGRAKAANAEGAPRRGAPVSCCVRSGDVENENRAESARWERVSFRQVAGFAPCFLQRRSEECEANGSASWRDAPSPGKGSISQARRDFHPRGRKPCVPPWSCVFARRESGYGGGRGVCGLTTSPLHPERRQLAGPRTISGALVRVCRGVPGRLAGRSKPGSRSGSTMAVCVYRRKGSGGKGSGGEVGEHPRWAPRVSTSPLSPLPPQTMPGVAKSKTPEVRPCLSRVYASAATVKSGADGSVR